MRRSSIYVLPGYETASIKERERLNKLQLMLQRKRNSYIHLLMISCVIILATRFKPSQAQNFLSNCFADTFLDDVIEESILAIPMIILFGFCLWGLERLINLLGAKTPFLASSINPLDEDLRKEECTAEISKLEAQLEKSSIPEYIEKTLLGLDYKRIWMKVTMAISFLLTRFLGGSVADLDSFTGKTVFTINSVLFSGIIQVLLTMLNGEWKKFTAALAYNDILLKELEKIVQTAKLESSIEIKLPDSQVVDTKDNDIVWHFLLIEDNNLTITNTRFNGYYSDDFYFYVMTSVGLMLNKYWDFRIKMIDKTSILFDVKTLSEYIIEKIREALDFPFIFSQKYLPSVENFRLETTQRLLEIKECYDGKEFLKQFLTSLLSHLKSPASEIEIIFNLQSDLLENLPHFDAVVQLSEAKTSEKSWKFNWVLFKQLLAEKNIPYQGMNFYILDQEFYIENCNILMKRLTAKSINSYINWAAEIRAILEAGRLPQLKIVNSMLPTPSENLTPAVVIEEKKKRPKSHQDIVDRKLVNFGRQGNFKIKFFAPSKPLVIAHIYWQMHASYDVRDDKSPTYFPLRDAKGEIQDFALLLPMVGEEIDKDFSAVLTRGKIARGTKTAGNCIRLLTAGEVASLQSKKPRLFTIAHQLYPDQTTLILTHKLKKANSETRIYGFRVQAEQGKIIYSNNTVSNKRVGLIVFCVGDYNSKKSGSSGIFSATSNPSLISPSSYGFVQ